MRRPEAAPQVAPPGPFLYAPAASMDITETAIPDVKILTPKRFGDARGFFSETYRRSVLAECGIDVEMVQENHSLSARPGTVRGLHCQSPPHAQVKLVRVVRGRILDAAVDVRRGSPTYGKHVAVELGADDFAQLLIPDGFLHGFCTLEPDTEVIYKVSAYYEPSSETGVRFDDPDLGIPWPELADADTLSAKDRELGSFADFDSPFAHRPGGVA